MFEKMAAQAVENLLKRGLTAEPTTLTVTIKRHRSLKGAGGNISAYYAQASATMKLHEATYFDYKGNVVDIYDELEP